MKVNVDGYMYEIRKVNPMSMELDSGTYLGRINYITQIIYIADNLSTIKEQEVLTHELTHAYLNRNKHQYEKYTEEDVCNMFELYAEKIIETVREILL